MKKHTYKVEFRPDDYFRIYEVKAESEEEAQDLALEQHHENLHNPSCEAWLENAVISGVELIKETS